MKQIMTYETTYIYNATDANNQRHIDTPQTKQRRKRQIELNLKQQKQRHTQHNYIDYVNDI